MAPLSNKTGRSNACKRLAWSFKTREMKKLSRKEQEATCQNWRDMTQPTTLLVCKRGGKFEFCYVNITEDLIIQVVEQNHDLYKRKGNDLYIEHTISLVESLCGCNISLEHLEEIINIEINTIIKPNSLFKVKGMERHKLSKRFK